MKRLFSTAIGAILSLAIAEAAVADEAAVQKTAQGNSAFAVELYQQVLKTQSDKNLFMSPYSISSALGMTAQGAKGKTAEQMTKVLHLGDMAAFQTGIADINTQINPPAGPPRAYELSTANALWADQRFPLDAAFVRDSGKFFGTPGVFGVDFVGNAEAARTRINGWVETQTHDKIKDLLAKGTVDASTVLVLTNAIYFKGTWSRQFDKKSTTDQPFHLSNGKDITVPLMQAPKEVSFSYGETADAQVLSLPYKTEASDPAAPAGRAARGRAPALPPGLSMVVVLPKKTDGLADLEKQVTTENVTKWLGGTRMQPVQVYLPKFTMTSEFELSRDLKALGMTDAFSNAADFSGIANSAQGKIAISAVIHKAFVDVNEEGTEAAAATAVTMMRSSAMIAEPTVFRADHPFLFMIRHEPTNSILFMGRVMNPKE